MAATPEKRSKAGQAVRFREVAGPVLVRSYRSQSLELDDLAEALRLLLASGNPAETESLVPTCGSEISPCFPARPEE